MGAGWVSDAWGNGPVSSDIQLRPTKPTHLRVDVGGIAIYVRTKDEYRYLTCINHKLAIAKLALHRIAATSDAQASGIARSAIMEMKDV